MPSRYAGTRAELRALDAWIKLNRCVGAVGTALRRGTVSSITPGQFAVLEALLHVGAQSPGDLARRVLRSPANITTVIDNLERDGLVERRREGQDRRVVMVHLTAAGRSAIQRVMPSHVAAIMEAFAALTVAEQEELARLCKKLGLAQPA